MDREGDTGSQHQGRPGDLRSEVFLGPPGTGKTHLAIGLAIRACQAGHRVLFATAAEWVSRLADAHHAGRLQAELIRLGRYPLLLVDEVGCIPLERGHRTLTITRKGGKVVTIPLAPRTARAIDLAIA